MTNAAIDKTNYRNVFKSDHLSSMDIIEMEEKGIDPVYTIKNAQQIMGAKVAGRQIDANIVYFHEAIKPMVVNAGNCAILQKLTGSLFVEDWNDITVRLYVDHNVRFGSDVVCGLRISPVPVKTQKQVITPENKKLWEGAKKAFLRDKNFDKVLLKAELSKEHQDQMIREINGA